MEKLNFFLSLFYNNFPTHHCRAEFERTHREVCFIGKTVLDWKRFSQKSTKSVCMCRKYIRCISVYLSTHYGKWMLFQCAQWCSLWCESVSSLIVRSFFCVTIWVVVRVIYTVGKPVVNRWFSNGGRIFFELKIHFFFSNNLAW